MKMPAVQVGCRLLESSEGDVVFTSQTYQTPMPSWGTARSAMPAEAPSAVYTEFMPAAGVMPVRVAAPVSAPAYSSAPVGGSAYIPAAPCPGAYAPVSTPSHAPAQAFAEFGSRPATYAAVAAQSASTGMPWSAVPSGASAAPAPAGSQPSPTWGGAGYANAGADFSVAAPTTFGRGSAAFGTQTTMRAAAHAPREIAPARATIGISSRPLDAGFGHAGTQNSWSGVARSGTSYRGYISGTSALAPDYWSDADLPSFAELSAAVDNLRRSADRTDEPSRRRPAAGSAAPARESGRRSGESAPVAPSQKTKRVGQRAVAATAQESAAAAAGVPVSHAVVGICAAVLVVCAAIISFICISWSSDTVMVQLASQDVTENISSARSAGRVLEVEESALSNASRIRNSALFLGMAEAESTEALYLPEDTVAVDEAGNLSLSESVSRVAEQQPAS